MLLEFDRGLFLCTLVVFAASLQLSYAQPHSSSCTQQPCGRAISSGAAIPDEVTLRLIIVSTAEQAGRIRDQLLHGADFVAIAKASSIDSTASDGGYVGKVALTSLRPELRAAVQGLKAGEFSPAVKTPLGYAVLQVLPETTAQRSITNYTGPDATAATGSVKYTINESGISEAEAALSSFPKPENWDREPRTICRLRTESLEAERRALEKYVAGASQLQNPPEALDKVKAYLSLGELDAYQGNMPAAIENYQKGFDLASARIPELTPRIEEILGIAYLHKSEMENDVYRVPGEKCIFPMSSGHPYGNTRDSEKAVEFFQKYLKSKSDELEVEWLLNIAYMTLGMYPDKVPKEYLIAPSVFASRENVGRFIDVAPAAGLNSFGMAGGIIVDDFENTGNLDIITSGWGSCSPMHFFHNNTDGTFTDRAGSAGLQGQLGGLNMIQGDYNNDGCTDILVLRGGWEVPQRKSLLHNNCDGTFTDVTAASGLDMPTSSQTAVWVDVNNDGLLDLFVGNENGPAQLFLNKGNGTFQDISHSAGVDRNAFSKGVATADYDNDGWPDLFVSNLTGPNFLYHNNHDNTFTEVSAQAGVQQPTHGFATWFFDYDNDGWPDLFVTSYYLSVDEVARTYLGLPPNATSLKLYKNMGDGTFRDVTVETDLDKVFMPMGANFGDIDNDGFLDIYLGNGNPSYGSLVPYVLLRNHDGRYFADVTQSSGTGELHKGHGVAFADLDNNGQEDILSVVGGAVPGDSHALRVFENPGNDNNWITLKLVGVKTNRSAIGARIKVTVENHKQETRSIYRTVGSGGSFGASPLAQHIGLGKSARISDLEVWWPASNTRQHFSNVATNQWLEITEFANTYTKLKRQSYRLGGARTAAVSNTDHSDQSAAK